MVFIHNNRDPKIPKGISKTIREYAHAHSQLPPSRWLRAERMKAIGKAIETAREAHEGLPLIIKN